MAENITSVITVVAEDPDADESVTAYAIVGGGDQDHFNITSPAGILTFTAKPDHESPTDTDTDNVYHVTVQATSGSAGLATQQAIQITVTNDADDSLSEAIDLGDITDPDQPQFRDHKLDNMDVVDYFVLTLTEPKKVTIGLTQQVANANLHLENAHQQTLQSSEKTGTADENLSATLLAGTYYLRIAAQEPGSNRYELAYSVSAADSATLNALLDAQSASEPADTDVVDTHSGSPQGANRPGSPATGTISSAADADVFRVIADDNRALRCEVKGNATENGTLPRPATPNRLAGDLANWHDLDGKIGGRPNAGTGTNESYNIDSAWDGTGWLLQVGGNGGTGTYTVFVTDISNARFTSPGRYRFKRTRPPCLPWWPKTWMKTTI